MARLPQPGSDDGTWGDILNDFLAQALKANGLLKDNAVTANTIAPNSVTNAAIASDAVNATSIADGSITNSLIADGTIQEIKLSSAVQTKLNATVPDADGTTKGKLQLTGDLGGTALSPTVVGLQGHAVNGSTPSDGQVLSYSTLSNSWVPSTVSSTTISDATTGSKGIVQLAGDLGGTASSPTVPALANKAPLASPTFTGTVTVPTPTNNTDAATKAYVDSAAASGTPDANASTKGKIQLTGDLGGTAASPQVAKILGIAISGTPSNGDVLTATSGTAASWSTPASAPVTSVAGKTGVVTLVKADVGLGNVDNTSDANKPISTATQSALDAKAPLASPTFTGTVTVPTPTNSTDAVTKAYVDSTVASGTPDADGSTKGKIQLAGDLGGTAASPQVAKILGIAISGTPTNGQVLTASSGTAASWTTPTGTLPALTSGSIPFSDGTTLAQDNDNFFWDNTNKRLGIGTNAPAVAIHVAGSTFATSQIQSYTVADAANSVLSLRRARSGTSAIQTGDIVGGISWRGHDGTSYGSDAASINVAATSNFTTSSHGTRLGFGVTPDGTTTSTTPMVLYGDRLDLSYDIAAPVNVQSGLNSTIYGKGDNASWKGVMAGSFQARDRNDVDSTNKGVLIGLLASVVPSVSRNNVPFDDVNGIMVSNEGAGKGTDAIYVAKHTSFAGQSEWLTTFTSDADTDSGMRLMGNYTYQALNLSDKFIVDPNGALFIANHSAPATPTGGGTLFVESDILKYKQPSGTVTTLSTIAISSINATGTPNSTTYLRGDGTWTTPPGTNAIARSINAISTTTTGAAVANTDYVYYWSGSSAYTFTLPTAVGNTNRYTLKNASTVNQTVATTSSQTVDGSTTLTLTPNTSLDVISTNANWLVI